MLSFITGKNEVIPLSGKQKPWIGLLVSLAVLTGAFLVGLLLQQIGPSQSLVSMILVMSVFLIALLTRGYLWGILASQILLSILYLSCLFFSRKRLGNVRSAAGR